MPRGQWRAPEQALPGGRPGPRIQGQAQAKVQVQAQPEAPFGNLLAAGLIAGAVTGVIEERMAEAATRQTGPAVSAVPPAEATPSAGSLVQTSGPPPPAGQAQVEGAPPVDAAAPSPSAGPDRPGPDAASPEIISKPLAEAAELPAQGDVVSAASILPALHRSELSAAADGSPSDGLTGRIAEEIADTIGRVVVKLGEISESGGPSGFDPRFGEALLHEIVGAASRIASDLTSTLGLPATDAAPLAKVASLPSEVLADVAGTVGQVVSALDIPPSLLGAEEDHATPPLLSRVFDHAGPAQPPAPHAPAPIPPVDAADIAISYPAADVGSVPIIFAGQSYVDAHDAHDWAFGPVTNLLHGFV